MVSVEKKIGKKSILEEEPLNKKHKTIVDEKELIKQIL